MAFIVDQLFPPINDREESVEFSSFNYWREPVMEIDCDSLLESNGKYTNNFLLLDEIFKQIFH